MLLLTKRDVTYTRWTSDKTDNLLVTTCFSTLAVVLTLKGNLSNVKIWCCQDLISYLVTWEALTWLTSWLIQPTLETFILWHCNDLFHIHNWELSSFKVIRLFCDPTTLWWQTDFAIFGMFWTCFGTFCIFVNDCILFWFSFKVKYGAICDNIRRNPCWRAIHCKS